MWEWPWWPSRRGRTKVTIPAPGLGPDWGHDNEGTSIMTTADTATPSPKPTSRPQAHRTRYVVLLVAGVLLAGLGLLLTGAATALGVAVFQRTSDGVVLSPTERYAVTSYAITSEQLDIVLDDGLPGARTRRAAPDVVLRATAGSAGEQIFIGVGPRDDVARYLSNVEHSELTQIRFSPFQPSFRTAMGSSAPELPASQTFWTVSAQGPGTQQIESRLRTGSWSLVIMNADGSRPVVVDLQAGLRSTLFTPVTWGALAAGLLLLAGAILMIVGGASGLGAGTRSTIGTPHLPTAAIAPRSGLSAPAALVAGTAPTYPARLNGDLDQHLSRWLWLVKWVLAVPHYVVLLFLWVAFAVTTVVAGFAILVTGRYPRSLFDFNVGVLRWSWRVGFYAYAALGTDRYPPFTLARTDYPADFDVDYPEHLSRGLVLVKSWLLALPHLLIVGLFTANLSYWWATRDSWLQNYQSTAGVSLLGLLVVIAGFFVLVTRDYPRPLFDLVLGLNRWQYRVITYVALMRDEYPPFHLDQGGRDSGTPGPASPKIEPAPVGLGV